MLNPLCKKILLVDDDQQVLRFLKDILDCAEYEIFSTNSGNYALHLARYKHPDLIILDINMPDMPGEDVAAILSEDPYTANIPIIFLTGILTKQEEASIKINELKFERGET